MGNTPLIRPAISGGGEVDQSWFFGLGGWSCGADGVKEDLYGHYSFYWMIRNFNLYFTNN